MMQELQKREIRGVNVGTILLIMSITASAVYTASRIESKIDAVVLRQEKDNQVIDLQIKEVNMRMDELKDEVLENRKRYKENNEK